MFISNEYGSQGTRTCTGRAHDPAVALAREITSYVERYTHTIRLVGFAMGGKSSDVFF